MSLYVIDFLEPQEFSPFGCHHFCEGAQGLAQWVFSVTAEYSVSTQGLLRAHSGHIHVHPELLTPLYSVQVAWFSAIFTIPKCPRSIPEHIMKKASQF